MCIRDRYLLDCIDSNFVSSVGAKVVEFEQQIAAFTGSKYAIATVNGTAALHVALQLAGVQRGDEVISPVSYTHLDVYKRQTRY